MEPRTRITELLVECRGGDRQAFDRLIPAVYDELRRIARRQIRRERDGHTLNATALVHETFLKLVDPGAVDWRDRGHFFAIAAGAMRRVLVDHARRHRTAKRGGKLRHLSLDQVEIAVEDRAADLIALDDALTRLAALDPRMAQVVELRFFAGLSEAETAAALGVTDRTVRRDWVKAKGWLYQEVSAEPASP